MKTDTKHTRIADDLFLIRQKVPCAAPAAPAELPTHHLMVVDCSGSMSADLPQLRAQLKKKLRTLLKEGDALSVVWFSGRGEFGTLFECERLPTLVDLKSVETAVDRWLKPIGLTGFKEPIEEVARLVERADYSSHSLVFMSDGQDNCWPRAEVLAAVERAAGGLSAATFVEYGYFADRALLAAMAERAGGQHVFAEHFNRYEPIVEAALRQRPVSGKRVSVAVEGDPIGGFAWTTNLETSELTAYGVEAGQVRVPDVDKLVFAYLSSRPVGVPTTDKENSPTHLYAALSLFGVRARPDIVFPILRHLGDVSFIREASGLFGKQRYSAFETRAREAVFDGSRRFTEGCDTSAVPRDDAYTVLEFLRLMETDRECRVLVDHPRFEYNRIGRKRVDAPAEGSVPPLRFTPKPMPEGCSVSGLTYNEDTPNVSILVRREGVVDLAPRLKPTELTTLLREFPTFIFRNYAIVKDGVVNISTLPVRLSEGALRRLMAESDAGRVPAGVVEGTGDPALILMHLDRLPVLNRRMVSTQTARLLFECEWALLKVQAAQKVYRGLLKEIGALKKSESFEQLYGTSAAEWLKDAGFTDYSGFNPRRVQAESTDYYIARELGVKLKGYASLPSLNEFRKQRDKGKLNGPAQLMLPAFEEASAHAKGIPVKQLEEWLESRADSLDAVRRSLLADKALAVFTTVVGGVWFTDCPTVGEGAMTLTLDGPGGSKHALEFSVEAREVQVKV